MAHEPNAAVVSTHALEVRGVGIDVDVCERGGADRCASPALDEMVRAILPPGAVARPVGVAPSARFSITWGHGRYTVRSATGSALDDAELVHASSSAPAAVHALDGAIRTAIALAAPGLVFVHAGVVAVDGRAIVLPGRSMAGKTTLTAALVRAGATYLSDEYAPLDADGLVHPYPRRLSVRGPAGRREVPVGDLGGRSASGPLPVALVATITHRPGATWSVRATDADAGAVALITNAVAARARPVEVLRAAGTVARGASHLTGERGEADRAADALLEALASR